MFDFIFIVRGDALQTTDRNRFFIDASAAARRFARPIACASEDPGKHVRIPVDHVRLGVLAFGDQADVLGYRRVRRTRVLAIHNLMEIFGIIYVCRFHFLV